MLLVGITQKNQKKKKVRTLVKQTLPTEWEVRKMDPTSYEDVDNLPLPRVRKNFGLLISDLQPVPAKMAGGFGKRTALLCCGGTCCSMGKCSPRPQRRKLTSVMAIRLNVATRLSRMVSLQRNACASLNQRPMRQFLSERLV